MITFFLKASTAVTDLRSPTDGYIPKRHCEGKSQATVVHYQYRLDCFMWFCQAYRYPDESIEKAVTDKNDSGRIAFFITATIYYDRISRINSVR